MNNKIVITTDGKETIARLYDGKKVIKSATALCHPDDTFDFNIGAKLAFERLIGTAESEWRVVNRPAKVGDYIRLLSCGGFSFSEVGDILKVDEVRTSSGGVCVLGKNHPRYTNAPNWPWYYARNEFEVVERVSAKKEEKPKYYNGKVVCIKRGYKFSIPLNGLTVGKIYTVIDGKIVDFDNDYNLCMQYKTLADLSQGMGHEFIPYVE